MTHLNYQRLALLLVICLSFSGNLFCQNWVQLKNTTTNPTITGINAITSYGYNNVYAIGSYRDDNGDAFVAHWDGSQWGMLDNLKGNYGNLSALYTDSKGQVYLGGDFFKYVNGKYHGNFLNFWDGNSWEKLGGDNALHGKVRALSITGDQQDNIYVAGYAESGSISNAVHIWDGNEFRPLQGQTTFNPNAAVICIASDKNDNIYAVGSFTDSTGYHYVSKWDGNEWSNLGNFKGNAPIWQVVCSEDKVYICGEFKNSNGRPYVAMWNGAEWSEVDDQSFDTFNGRIRTMAADSNGAIYVGGDFSNLKNNPYIAKWDGNSWSELGGKYAMAGICNILGNAIVYEVHCDNTGNIYAGGHIHNDSLEIVITRFNSGLTSLNAIDVCIAKTYPNPSTGLVNIVLADQNLQNSNIQCFDQLGREVQFKMEWLDKKVQLSFSHYHGIVYIEIQNGLQRTVEKVLIL